MKCILRYLKGTYDHSVFFYSTNEFTLTAFSNVDWDSGIKDRRSTSGYLVFLRSNPIAWS